MMNVIDVIKSLPELWQMKAASDEQINEAEIRLGVKFSSEYREYLSAFGAIIADGIELSGIAKSEHRNVVFLTEQAWELNHGVPHSMYVIENTCVDGIIIWQDTEGSVYKTKPDHAPEKIADSLADYIIKQINN